MHIRTFITNWFIQEWSWPFFSVILRATGIDEQIINGGMIFLNKSNEVTEIGVEKCLEWIYTGQIELTEFLIETLYVAKELKLTKLIYQVSMPIMAR